MVDFQDGLAELGDLGRGGRPSEMGRHELVARADPENRAVEGVEVFAVLSHLLRVDPDPGSAARQDEATEALEFGLWQIVRTVLRSHPRYLRARPSPWGPL